jgi:hypothetical protein
VVGGGRRGDGGKVGRHGGIVGERAGAGQGGKLRRRVEAGVRICRVRQRGGRPRSVCGR